ncbi:TonB-dependent receptor [Horticoccus sp. 23ND18S-11]|uniref:TonB-dependent receptor n=1 Tax=Horticoccus sp. 23ND18S-11 TaxID=3391832 RepID=UPI0039C9D601
MNYLRVSAGLCNQYRLLRVATSLFACLAFALPAIRAAAAGTGSVAGSISSSTTRNALQGATVSVPALNRSEFTDGSGGFVLQDLPVGAVEVVISYSGFTDEKRSVTVRAGEVTRLDTEMKASQALMMDAFTVATQKEGQALSITEQRNAFNIKNVTAFDEWGVLPTQNVGELVTRLPGITFTTDEDQLINNVSIRGQPASYTRLNVDGMSTTGVGGDGRTATLHSFSGSQYEQVEIIAGQTPDKRADSLGGQLNLKTRSPLAMSEKRRTTYTMSGRYFPSWSKRNYALSERPLRPDFSLTHTEVFDVGNGRRNLGIVIGASYQEVINPHGWDTLLYENTTNPVAQLRDYTRTSGFNDRFLTAFSARADYQISRSTRVSLRFLYNGGSEPFFNYTAVNPWVSTNLTVNDPVTNPNGAIKAGYTANRIEILPVANTALQPGGVSVGAAQMRLNPQRYSFTSKNPTGTLAFEHNFGRLKLDHAYRWSNTHWDSGAGRKRENGTVAMRTKDPIGFILDSSDRLGRVFTQTAGPSVTNPASYASFVITAANTTTQPVPVTSTVFNKRDTVTDTNEVSANVNGSYLLPTEIPITIKTGVDTVNRRVNNRPVYPRRWYAVAGTVLPVDGLMPLTEFESQNGGARLPIVDPAAISTTLGNTAIWYEDVNFTATQQYTNRRIMEEGVDAAFVQGQAKLGNFNLLAGVRGEWVTTDTFTYFRARTTTVAAEPDHFKRAALDFARLSRDGKYNKYFPSVHLGYDITRNLKARASWSTSYGRPLLANLIASPTANDTARTVTLGNPALKPQLAKNIDVKLEYYYSSTGMVSVSGYKKKITEYIGSSARSGVLVPEGADNGFDGLYGGYEIIQANNLGDANLTGFEADFRQRLTFLPGVLKGLTARANYTYLETKGKFAGTVDLQPGQVAGFIPRAANFGLLYTYKNFGASFDVNYTGKYPVGYSLTSPGNGNIYRQAWTRMNAGVTYKFRRDTTVFLNVNNIAEEGPEQYTFIESRIRSAWTVPRSLKFGVTGQF